RPASAGAVAAVSSGPGPRDLRKNDGMSGPERAAWPAPRVRHPLDAAIRLPGSKSLTNRALVLAALGDGPSMLRRPLVARDSRLMSDALRALGVRIETVEGGWRVWPEPLRGPAAIDCGLAGTVMRFLPPVAAL